MRFVGVSPPPSGGNSTLLRGEAWQRRHLNLLVILGNTKGLDDVLPLLIVADTDKLSDTFQQLL